MSVHARYLLVFAGVYPVLRLLACAAVFWICGQVEQGPGRRVPDLRVLPSQAQHAALRFYLRQANEQGDGKGLIVVSGDSQVYGHSVAAAETFAAVVGKERPESTVINVAKLGASYAWVRQAVEAAREEGIALDTLIFNANPLNHSVAPHTTQHVPENFFASLLLSQATMAAFFTIFGSDFFFRRPAGPAAGTFQLVNLPDRYFAARLSPETEAEFRSVLDLSAHSVRRVVVVLSPHFYEPYNREPYAYGWDTTAVVRRYREICESYRHALCLDVSTEFAQGYFVDAVHLNREGHRVLGRRIACAMVNADGLSGKSLQQKR